MTELSDRPWEAGEAYPWSGHVLRHLGLVLDFDDDRLVTTMAAGPHVIDDDGRLLLGALGLLIDLPAGVLSIQHIQPDWTVTFDVDAHVVNRPLVGPELVSTGEVVRIGRNNVITEARVVDGSGLMVGHGLITFTRLPRTPEMQAPIPPRERRELVDPVPADGHTFIDHYMGFQIDHRGGTLTFDPGRRVANALGAIQGGVTISAMSTAAGAAASRVLGRRAMATDVHVYYIGLGKVGPYQTRTEVLHHDDNEALVRCSLVDTGADDRLLALGTVSTRARSAATVDRPASG